MKNIITIILFIVSPLVNAQTCFTPSYSNSPSLSFISNNLDKKIYFLGETHNVACNDILDYTILMELQKIGVNNFIREGSYSFNFFLDKYILTGNKKYLDSLGSDYNVKEIENFLAALHNFNSNQLEKGKIRIRGIDSEPFYHLKAMVNTIESDHGKAPEIVKSVFDALRSFQTTEWKFLLNFKEKKQIKAILQKAKPLFNNNQKVFQDYLKDDYLHIYMVINNNAILRRGDKGLHQNFKMLSELLSIDKFYISYGNLHAQHEGGWLASQIENDGYNNQVLSIKTIYQNSKMLWGSSTYPLNDLDKYKTKPKIEVGKCNSEFIESPSSIIGEEQEKYDYVIIAYNQNEITIEQK